MTMNVNAASVNGTDEYTKNIDVMLVNDADINTIRLMVDPFPESIESYLPNGKVYAINPVTKLIVVHGYAADESIPSGKIFTFNYGSVISNQVIDITGSGSGVDAANAAAVAVLFEGGQGSITLQFQAADVDNTANAALGISPVTDPVDFDGDGDYDMVDVQEIINRL